MAVVRQISGKPKRQVSRSVRQRQHPRPPVVLTCKACGHSWESFGAHNSLIKCPRCGKGQRLKRHDAGSALSIGASSQVRSLDVERLPAHHLDIKRASVTMPEPPDDDDQGDYLPAPVSREAELDRVAAMLAGRSVPGPVGVHPPDMMKRFRVSDENDIFITTIAVRLREKWERKGREPLACANCSRRPGFTTSRLYIVDSPALSLHGGPRLLCMQCKDAEMVAAGGLAVPYP